MTLPCGCVIDIPSLGEAVEGYFDCPWCGATFDGVEFHDWCVAGLPAVLIERTFPLCVLLDKLFEVVSRCGCGDFIVRMRGTIEEVHLPATMPVQPLRD
jgi:hypothetical protein